ncbi:MAG: SH3 domain-containing protein [Bacteroidota bacterium]
MKKLLLLSFTFLVSLSLLSQPTKYVSATSLNVRSGPSTNKEIVHKLYQNDKVVQLKTEGAWSYISYSVGFDQYNGYVATKFLSTYKVTVKKAEAKVLICNSKSSYAYHNHYCRGLNRCKSDVGSVTVSTAVNRGYRACKNCY